MKPSTLTQLQSRLYGWLMRKTTLSAIRRVGELPIAVISDIGNLRNQNQDRVAVLKVQLELNQPFVVLALCDGMGGMVEGAACASQTIASFFISCITNRNIVPSSRLAIAAQDANRVVHDTYKGSGGGTLSAILFDSTGLITGVNIGDSRIYSYGEFRLEQLTVDDTMSGLRPGADNDLHARNELLQYIGMGDGMEPHIIESPSSWDLMILTSDGAHYFDKGVMSMVIQNAKEPALAAKRLIEIAKWCGGRDNASIAIASPVAFQQQLSNDTELIQVWDPFGEVQILVAEADADGEIRKEPPKTPPPVNQRKPNQKKRSARTKKKTEIDQPKEADGGQLKKTDDIEKDRPLVNIYFNGDSDKDQNA